MGKLTKKLKWDCHLEGHDRDESLTVRNSARPEVIGWRCLKCRCLIYEIDMTYRKPEVSMAEVDTAE